MKKRDSERMGRREMLKLTASASIIMPDLQAVPRIGTPSQKPHDFFTNAEFRMVDELSDLIIPDDDHSPGARAAKVVDYVDKVLGESWDEALKQRWREGLKLINALAREMHGKAFMRASKAQRISVLERIARGEADPKTPEERFFVELKSRVARGYYTSKIGLRQELEYKGNTYLREFVGE